MRNIHNRTVNLRDAADLHALAIAANVTHFYVQSVRVVKLYRPAPFDPANLWGSAMALHNGSRWQLGAFVFDESPHFLGESFNVREVWTLSDHIVEVNNE